MTGAMEKFSKNRWYRDLALSASPAAFHLGFILVEHFLFPGKRECWATQEKLGELARTTDRNVRRLTQELVEIGALTMRRGGKGHANRYVPCYFDRTNSSDQNLPFKSLDRTNSSCVDRTNSSAEIPIQNPGVGPTRQVGPVSAESTFSVVDEVATTSAAPDAPLPGAGRHVAALPTEADEEDEPSFDERISTLEVDIRDLIEQGLPVPDQLAAFLDRGHEPDDADLEELESLARSVIDEENERVERQNFEIDAARATVAARKAGGIVLLPSEPTSFSVDLSAFEALRAARPQPCGSARTMLADQVRVADFADRLLAEALKRPADQRPNFWLNHIRRVTSALVEEGIPRHRATEMVGAVARHANQIVSARSS